jgi:hypothetical protein
MNTKILLLYLAVASQITGIAFARDGESLPVWKPKTKKIIAFKNGLAFVLKEGATPLKDGWARTEQLPAASLGAIWAGSETGHVTDLIAYKEKEIEETDALTQAELLGANVGGRVLLTYNIGTTVQTVEGTLLSVPKRENPGESAAGQERLPAHYAQPIRERSGDLVLVRNDQGFVVSVNHSTIQAVRLQAKASLKSKREREVSRARLKVDGSGGKADLSLAYLVKGITWSPSYRLDIADEKTARISLDAVLANDVEDIEDAEISFVVGYPNFLHADIISPLSLHQSVANFIQLLENGRFAESTRLTAQNIAFNNAAWFDSGSSGQNSYTTTKPLAGERNEDLYFYQRKDITLHKGDRASCSVFQAAVPYEHIYRWNIPDNMNVDDRGNRRDGESAKGIHDQVWHMLRLQNTTKQPWTTAPAFTMKGTLPLAQDTLNYAPPGSSTLLKLTVATDIRGESSQNEVSRRPVNIEGRSYEEVVIEGKLKVTNWKDTQAKLVVNKTMVGEVVGETTGKVNKMARGVASLNPTSQIEWEFLLEPGKANELDYRYKVLITR